MGLDKNQLLEYFLTDNKSGWKCVPKKLNNNNPKLYNNILNFLENSNIPEDIKFKQKVWHFIYKENNIITCKECGSPSKFLDIKRGYQDFCSTKCSNKNKDKIEKTKKNNIEKWGVATPFENKEIYNRHKESLLDEYGVINVGQLNSVKNKIEDTNIKKYGYKSPFGNPEFRKKHNEKTSKIEKYVAEKLGCEHKFILEGKEYDLKHGEYLIEVDGDYHHPKNLLNLSLTQLSSIINDYEKNSISKNNGYELIRVNTSKLKKSKIINLDYIKQNQYKQDYTLSYDDVIISKEYLKEYCRKYGKEKLQNYVYLFLKFIRTFQPEFPIIKSDEHIQNVVSKIHHFKKPITKIVGDKLYFNNNTSNVGVSYLKNIFTNYWESSYKGNKSPKELWYDDDFMRKVIAYRIGLNDNNEFYDFSIKNIIKGFSANRKTISFFKPLLASSIYKHYIGNKTTPVVLDPCFGFGGRLMGFKSVYPNGKYIGIDPDINGYNNIQKLSNNFNNVELYNVKLENFNTEIDYDIAFTSIPYFDLETYSDNVEYSDFDEWKNTFISKLLSLPRLLVNMSYKLCEELNLTNYIDSYIESNTSHFNKTSNKKLEVIIKINF